MSAANLQVSATVSKMNSDVTSRKIDADLGLKDFVRLSFGANNPMMHVAKKEGRIDKPVVLRVKLEAVSRPGVLFTDCNATRHDATISADPGIVRFDVVKAESMFLVPQTLRRF